VNNAPQPDNTQIPEPPPRRRKLPCGAKVCLHCHKNCGVITAAYLGISFDSGEDEQAQ